MLVPILNILVGAALIVGGATRTLALFGTNSSTALVVVGGVIAVIGAYQLVRSLQGR